MSAWDGSLDALGRSAIMYAVHEAQLYSLQLLLDDGFDPNHTAHGAHTMLFRLQSVTILHWVLCL